MVGTSRVPRVTTRPVFAPLRSISVLVTSVVPWTTSMTGARACTAATCFSRSAITVVTASPGSRGVVSVFATQMRPPGASTARPSVKVPPMSTAMRMLRSKRAPLFQRGSGATDALAGLGQLLDRGGDGHAEVRRHPVGPAVPPRYAAIQQVVHCILLARQGRALGRALAEHASAASENVEGALRPYALDAGRFAQQLEHPVAALLERLRPRGHEILR